MSYFRHEEEQFYIEGVALESIAANCPTPFYCYSQSTIEANYLEFAAAFTNIQHEIFFAVKANSNLSVLKLLGSLGAGADCVSLGDIKKALHAGIAPEKIIFSGVGKTPLEMMEAIKMKIRQINVESLHELRTLHAVAKHIDCVVNIAFRINPDVATGGHDKITTGRAGDKFGIDWSEAITAYQEAKQMSHIKITGISMHIGSQICDMNAFRKAAECLSRIIKELMACNIQIINIDVGGGLAISYQGEEVPSKLAYQQSLMQSLDAVLPGATIFLEPGRVIVGNAGILVAKVLYIKRSGGKTFVVLDAGMNDIMRPALYDAQHKITAISLHTTDQFMADIVGPICESSDVLARDVLLPSTLQQGDLVVIHTTGAYGSSMSSNYNNKPLIGEIMVSADKWRYVRSLQTYEQMWQNELG